MIEIIFLKKLFISLITQIVEDFLLLPFLFYRVSPLITSICATIMIEYIIKDINDSNPLACTIDLSFLDITDIIFKIQLIFHMSWLYSLRTYRADKNPRSDDGFTQIQQWRYLNACKQLAVNVVYRRNTINTDISSVMLHSHFQQGPYGIFWKIFNHAGFLFLFLFCFCFVLLFFFIYLIEMIYEFLVLFAKKILNPSIIGSNSIRFWICCLSFMHSSFTRVYHHLKKS